MLFDFSQGAVWSIPLRVALASIFARPYEISREIPESKVSFKPPFAVGHETWQRNERDFGVAKSLLNS
jgi:hypothetical protein